MPKPTRRIGASKLATVYESQMPDGTLVAVKCFDRQNLSNFKHDRFFSAAKTWQTLSNPLLVRYLDVKPESNEIVQELWDRSAAVRLNEGSSDPKLVFHVLRDVLKALAFLHDLGYLHGNIKPTNVFFSPRGHAMLSDGLLVDSNQPGTLPPPINQKYLTPEHTNDAYGPMSPSTDLYSAGFLALELLAGNRFGRAFQGVGDDAPEDDLAWFQWHGSSLMAPDANLFAKACPVELTQVIRKLVAKDPVDRYRSAEHALSDLPESLIIVPPSAPITASQVQGRKLGPEQLASCIVERPTNGVVLVIASGNRAGEMIGTDLSEFRAGFSDDCLICFESEKHSDRALAVFSRTPEGWSIRSEQENPIFINEQLLFSEERPLRSGDIIRLSANGPDLQFTLQSGGFDIRQLVSRFFPGPLAPSNPNIPASNPVRVNPTNPPTVIPPKGPGVSAPSGPIKTTTLQGGSTPKPPKSPQGQPAPIARNLSNTPGNSSPANLNNRQIAEKQTIRPPSQTPNNTRANPNTQPKKPLLANQLFQPNTWSKQQKNWAILIGGLCLISLILIIPTSPTPSNSKKIQSTPKPETNQLEPTALDPNPDPKKSVPTKSDHQSTDSKELPKDNPFVGLDDVDQ